MRARQNFSNISPDEQVRLAFDFSKYLATGDSLVEPPTCNCTVADKSPMPDAAPATRLLQSPEVDGALVIQMVGGCLAGVVYVVEAVCMTLGGERLSIWAYLTCHAPGE